VRGLRCSSKAWMGSGCDENNCSWLHSYYFEHLSCYFEQLGKLLKRPDECTGTEAWLKDWIVWDTTLLLLMRNKY
jgi:hypothetical protein